MDHGFRHAAIIDDEFPIAFQCDLVKLILNQSQLSHDRCFGSREHAEAHYLWPHQRRADIEGGFRALATKHGLSTRSQPFEKNGEYYSVIETPRVICTLSHVNERFGLPRIAKARETTAQDAQLNMFPTAAPPSGTKLYVIITYGGSSEESILPAFIDAIIPSRDYTCVVDRVRLLDRFTDELGGSGEPINDIPDTGGPTIRTQPNTEA